MVEQCAKEIHSGRSQDLAEQQKHLVHAVTPGQPQRTGPGMGTARFYKCLRRDHTPDECPHGSAVCFRCGSSSRFQRACKQIEVKTGGGQPSQRGVQVVQDESEEEGYM